ncbi:MAG: sulfotransferase [Cyanobacteria bacterium P01_A01_bin.123]
MSKSSNLPNLLIIGAMKSGTTSLHYYLDLHPEICMSRAKELNFFIEEFNWNQGVQWYRSHFLGQAKIYGESSPNYTRYPKWKGVPHRIFSVIPETKLIYLVRDPIERIISHYIHFYSNNMENRSIDEALAKFDGNLYVDRSKYFFQLEQYFSYFSNANILILTSEELLNYPQKTMKKVFQFLEVDDSFQFKFRAKNLSDFLRFGPAIFNSNFQFNMKLHESSRKRRITMPKHNSVMAALAMTLQYLPPELRCHLEKVMYRPFSQKIERPRMSDALRDRLLEYLADDIKRLQSYAECDFKEWNISPS